MYRRYVSAFRFLAVFLILVFAVGCAGVSEKWDTLTPAEQSRIILDGMQSQLDNLFDTGKAYVVLHPEYSDTWKTKIAPAFSAANKSIAAAIKLSMSENITPAQVYETVQPLISEVINLLKSIGIIKGVS